MRPHTCLLPLLALFLALPGCDRPDPIALATDAEAQLNALYPKSEAIEAAIDADRLSEQLAILVKPFQSTDFDAWEARGGGKYGPSNDIDNLRRGQLPRPDAEPAIALLDEAVTDDWLRPFAELRASPRLVREWSVDSTGQGIDPLGGRVRATMRILLARSRVQHHRSDLDGAAEAAEYALALGRAMLHDPVLLNRLTGVSVQTVTLAEIRHQLLEGGHDEASCTRLLEAVGELSVASPLRPALEVEAILIPPTYAGQGYSAADIRAVREALEADMDRLESLQYKPYVEQDENADFVGLAFASLGSNKRYKRPELIEFQHGAVAFLLLSEARWRNERDATTLLLRIHLYRHRHGRFPETLDQLTPGQITVLPADSITGAPFQYRLVDGRPILYSVGRDRNDDGGEHHQPTDLLSSDLIGGPDILFTAERPAVPDLDAGFDF